MGKYDIIDFEGIKLCVSYPFYQLFSCSTNAAPNPNTNSVSSADDLQQKLTPLQYKVTQENDTEPPFKNEYWDNKEAGIYVDIVSGEPLFSSTHKLSLAQVGLVLPKLLKMQT